MTGGLAVRLRAALHQDGHGLINGTLSIRATSSRSARGEQSDVEHIDAAEFLLRHEQDIHAIRWQRPVGGSANRADLRDTRAFTNVVISSTAARGTPTRASRRELVVREAARASRFLHDQGWSNTLCRTPLERPGMRRPAVRRRNQKDYSRYWGNSRPLSKDESPDVIDAGPMCLESDMSGGGSCPAGIAT